MRRSPTARLGNSQVKKTAVLAISTHLIIRSACAGAGHAARADTSGWSQHWRGIEFLERSAASAYSPNPYPGLYPRTMVRLYGPTLRHLGWCVFAALDTPYEFSCPGSNGSFNGGGPEPGDGKRLSFTCVQMLENAEIVQVCPMSGPCYQRPNALRISLWHKELGSECSVFGDQEALLDGSPKCPMPNSRRCSVCFRRSLTRRGTEKGMRPLVDFTPATRSSLPIRARA
jgi:hypothetical protein